MKKIIIVFALLVTSCVDMYLPPKNTVTDEDMFGSPRGMSIYMARLYSMMPFEDFKYMAEWGITFNGWLQAPGIDGCGEAVNRDGTFQTFRGESNPFWGQAFVLLHDANYVIETLSKYQDNFSEAEMNYYLGQAYFVRAYTFYRMAVRFGGVPLVTHTIAYPATASELEVPRSSEEETWNQIAKDFDEAIKYLPEQSIEHGLADKYVALAYKAEAMLYAGSVAKYNETVSGRLTGLGAKTGVRVIGFDAATAHEASIRYFSESYKASREIMKSARYSLYKAKWDADNKEAQYQNMVSMFSDLSSPENIFVKEYLYPTLTHSIDGFSSPYTFRNPLSSGSCPSLDFVELFDGFDRYPDGTIRVTDGNSNAEGKYILYDKPMVFFKNAEPRLRAYIIFPGDTFRGKEMDIRTGIYVGEAGPKPLWSDYSYQKATENLYQLNPLYSSTPKLLYLSRYSESSQEIVEIDGVKWTAAGAEGPFYDKTTNEATLSGFYLRKWLNPDPATIGGEGNSSQPFILMRYADVLLAAAEAAVELSIAAVASPVEGDDMLAIATDAINAIRERAGASLLESNLSGNNDSRDLVRKERRKELAFEHKTKWDIRRWRVQHYEGRDGFWGIQIPADRNGNVSGYRLRGLFPFYSAKDHKYFFDANYQISREKELQYNAIDYYFEIPSNEVAKSPVIDQQPNR